MNINILTKDDLGCLVRRVSNGYEVVQVNEEGDYFYVEVIQDSDEDGLKSGEELLWTVIDAVGIGGSRHDKERLVIRREPGDKHEDGGETK